MNLAKGEGASGAFGLERGDRAVWEELHHKDPWSFWLDWLQRHTFVL